MHKQRLAGPVWCPLPLHRSFPGTVRGHGASPACRLQQKEAAGKEEDKPRDWEHADFRMEAALRGALGDAV